jgi:hypothetical protein
MQGAILYPATLLLCPDARVALAVAPCIKSTARIWLASVRRHQRPAPHPQSQVRGCMEHSQVGKERPNLKPCINAIIAYIDRQECTALCGWLCGMEGGPVQHLAALQGPAQANQTRT